MLTNFNTMLDKARISSNAIGQFNINNMEWTKEILLAAQQCNVPVILGITENTSNYLGGFIAVVEMVKGLINSMNIDVDVCLNLDHGKTINTCKAAINAGFTAVMFDGSGYTLEENISLTNLLCNYARERCCSVEGQLGEFEVDTDGQTNFDECKVFLENTEVNCLAVSCGSKHSAKVKTLDISLLKNIQNYRSTNLSLHGGSGVPSDFLIKAIKAGCCKVNINTESMCLWVRRVREILQKEPFEYNPRKIIGSGLDEMRENIIRRINFFNNIEGDIADLI